MSPVLIAVYALALVMLGGAVAFVLAGRERAGQERTADRFDEVAFTTTMGRADLPAERGLSASVWFAAPLLRAGITPQAWHPLLAVALLGLVGVGGFLAAGPAGALGGLAVVVLIGWVFLRIRTGRNHDRMFSQLPGFIDSVLRAVAAGRNLENAIGAAREHTPDPLRTVFDRVLRRVQLGGDLGDGLDEARQVYRLRELALLRLVVVIGQRYGGSVKEPLASVAALIRQHEQNQREMRAMTGEVRLSSWIMGLLPLALAIYVMSVNPQYLMTMWSDPSGRMGLAAAALMQVAGVVALWRLVKSVL